MTVSIDLHFDDLTTAAKVLAYADELVSGTLKANVECNFQGLQAADDPAPEHVSVPEVEPEATNEPDPEPEPAGFTKDRSRGIYFYLPGSKSFGVTYSTEEWEQVLEPDGAQRISKGEYESKEIVRKDWPKDEPKAELEAKPYTTAHGRAALQQIASQVEYSMAEQTLNELGYGRISDVPEKEMSRLIEAARNAVPDSAAFDDAISAIN